MLARAAGPDPGRVRSSYSAQRVAKCSEGRLKDSEQALEAPHCAQQPDSLSALLRRRRGPVSPLATRPRVTCDYKKGNDTMGEQEPPKEEGTERKRRRSEGEERGGGDRG